MGLSQSRLPELLERPDRLESEESEIINTPELLEGLLSSSEEFDKSESGETKPSGDESEAM